MVREKKRGLSLARNQGMQDAEGEVDDVALVEKTTPKASQCEVRFVPAKQESFGAVRGGQRID